MDRVNYIKTLNGVFDFDDIESNRIDIYDVITSMVRTIRFNGLSPVVDSVLTHSMGVLNAIERTTPLSATGRLNILLHDAAETYIGNIVGPFKNMLNEWCGGKLKEFEERIKIHIFNELGIEYLPDVQNILIPVIEKELIKESLVNLWVIDKECPTNNVVFDAYITFQSLIAEMNVEEAEDENVEDNSDGE